MYGEYRVRFGKSFIHILKETLDLRKEYQLVKREEGSNMNEMFESLINYGRNVSKTGNYTYGFGWDSDAPARCWGKGERVGQTETYIIIN